ncbi:hypothetical protein AB205_0091380 [Aquarana catesbeiana]|uniref:Uncharacterized protein n=1 Tax=Aquarana catesbeiana TaxID=8400 RepID=A0A2G9R7Q8_AQUCT|nr:hypothetical protein AB205_0091380 [Aquarana catesbeiana]
MTIQEATEETLVGPQIKGAGSVQKDQESDVQVVVPKSNDFTSDSAQRMIQEIMFCSHDLDIIKEKTKEIEQRLKNMIDVQGRI